MFLRSLTFCLACGALPLAAGIATTAAAQTNQPIYNQQLFTPVEEEAKYEYKRNTNPQDAYEFSVILYGAPANLEAITANAHYLVKNCSPADAKPEDDPVTMKSAIPVEFIRTSPTLYTGTVYFDAMLNEDYLQQGKVCEWEWNGFGLTFEPKPNLSQIQYTASILPDAKVSDGLYQQERYITRLNFNQEKKREQIIKAIAVADKSRFSKEAQEQLVTFNLELKKK